MKAIDVVGWVLIFLGIIFLLWRILGGSPTELSIILTLMSGVMFRMMSMESSLGEVHADVKHMRRQFFALANDFKTYMREK